MRQRPSTLMIWDGYTHEDEVTNEKRHNEECSARDFERVAQVCKIVSGLRPAVVVLERIKRPPHTKTPMLPIHNTSSAPAHQS